MDDQRIEARAALGLEHRRDRRLVRRIAAEAIDRLGREDDRPSGADLPGRLGDARGVRLHGRRPQAMNQGLEKRGLP